MKLTQIATVLFLGAAIGTSAFSQPGPGPGAGMGPGGGKGMSFKFNQDNTRGWNLMSAEERTAHRDKMTSAKTYEECKAIQDQQHQTMETRAKEKGVSLAASRQNGCDRMKAQGFFK